MNYEAITACATTLGTILLIYGIVDNLMKKLPEVSISSYPTRMDNGKMVCMVTIRFTPNIRSFYFKRLVITNGMIGGQIAVTYNKKPPEVPDVPTSKSKWANTVKIKHVIPTESEMTVYPLDPETSSTGDPVVNEPCFVFFVLPSSSDSNFLKIQIWPSIWSILSLRSVPIFRTIQKTAHIASRSERIEI